MTEQEKLARTKRRIIYLKVAVVIAAIIVIFSVWKGCQKAKDAQIAYKAILDTLQSVLQDTARIQGEARKLKYENADLDLHIADLVADLQTTKGALIDESDKVTRLASEVRKAKANKDTITRLEKCDSLTEEVGYLQKYVDQILVVSARKDSLHNVKIKNIEDQRDLFKNGYDSCKNAVVFTVTELPKIKPKSKVYVVASGIVSGPVLGIGGGFTYVSKNGLLISAKAFATNQGMLTQAGFGVPLSFKRK